MQLPLLRRTLIAVSLGVVGLLSLWSLASVVPAESFLIAVNSGASGSPTLRPIDFPRLRDLGGYSVDSYLVPNYNSTTTWRVGLGRLAIVLMLQLFWLRGLVVCSRHEKKLQANGGLLLVFLLGSVGSVAALLVPVYLPLFGLLLVTNVLPFWAYKWVWNRSAQPETKLGWREFFTFPADMAWHDTKIKFEPLVIGAQPASDIRLSEKATFAYDRGRGALQVDADSSGYTLARSLIGHVVTSNATDLHISTKSDRVVAQQRVDGSINTLVELPLELGRSVINVFKVMSDLNIADRRRSQDGSFSVDVNDRRLSFRVCSQGTEGGQKLSIRILDPAKTFTDFSTLGMTSSVEARVRAAITRPHGLILVAGATGAGKSTTACAALRTIDPHERNIISIEDPIEYRIPSVDQIDVHSRSGQTFESVLRSVLRQDADVIFIGEIRDEETAKMACRAAMTGQLVLATLHANSAIGGVMRMIELGVDLQNLADSLRAVLSQTLLRKMCMQCRIGYRLDPATVEQLEAKGMHGLDGELFRCPEDTDPVCPNCNGRGFFRRTGVFEWLSITPAIADLIQERARPATILTQARKDGMTTLAEEALRLVREGQITLDEYCRIFDCP